MCLAKGYIVNVSPYGGNNQVRTPKLTKDLKNRSFQKNEDGVLILDPAKGGMKDNLVLSSLPPLSY